MKHETKSGGIFLIVIGVYFLLRNVFDINLLGVIDINWSYIWPLILIGFGVKNILNK